MSGVESLAGWFQVPHDHRSGRASLVHVLEPGEVAVLADVRGPGCFRHLTFTASPEHLRDLVLEAWWDDELAPSIECPVPDFFGAGHGGHNAFGGDLSSLLLRIAPRFGYNSYFPMPFARRGLLRLRNDGAARIGGIHFQGDFHQYMEPVETPLRFHATWRRTAPAYRRAAPLTLLETQGSGYLAGVTYHVHKTDDDDRWTHGGADLIFLDGLDRPDRTEGPERPARGRRRAALTPDPHFLHGDGGEDFYGGAWGLYPHQGAFAGAHHAHPLPGLKDGRHSWEQHEDGRYSMYRWYVDSPIAFSRSLRLAFCTEANEISATTYWYQGEPHPPARALPPVAARAYGAPLRPEDGERPLHPEGESPVAVLGPFRSDQALPWTPAQGVSLATDYETTLDQPYQDVVGPPWRVRWQTTRTRHHFVNLQAVHRSKRRLTSLGLAGHQRLPVHVGSYILLSVSSDSRRSAVVECGFEDRLELWCNGRRIEECERLHPVDWGIVRVPVQLEAGRNEIVLWQTNDRAENWSGWAAFVRLRAPDGGPLRDVTVDELPDVPPTLEYWREGDVTSTAGPHAARGARSAG